MISGGGYQANWHNKQQLSVTFTNTTDFELKDTYEEKEMELVQM